MSSLAFFITFMHDEKIINLYKLNYTFFFFKSYTNVWVVSLFPQKY